MQYRDSFKNANHHEVFGKVQQCKELRQTCRLLFQWLVERYAANSDFDCVLEDGGNAVCITTPAGNARSRVFLMDFDSTVIARVVFFSHLDPADSAHEVPVFALTVENYYSVTSGDLPGRTWESARSPQDLWASKESLALGYDLLAGQLQAALQQMAVLPHS